MHGLQGGIETTGTESLMYSGDTSGTSTFPTHNPQAYETSTFPFQLLYNQGSNINLKIILLIM
jgi:hypothetical protein